MPNPSAGPKQGSTAPSPDPECLKLDSNTKKSRAAVIRKLEKKSPKSQEVSAALKKAKGKGMTISSITSTVPGAQGTFTASSSGIANAAIPNGSCDGGTSEQKMGLNKKTRQSKNKKLDSKKKKAGVLCGQSHVHPGGGKGAHAECKVVNSLTNKAIKTGAAMRGGSMVMKIDWRSSTFDQGETSGMPCADCYRMMCHASKECDIKIFICDKDNQQQEVSEDDCDSLDGYEKLCTRVDGNPTPGR